MLAYPTPVKCLIYLHLQLPHQKGEALGHVSCKLTHFFEGVGCKPLLCLGPTLLSILTTPPLFLMPLQTTPQVSESSAPPVCLRL